MKAHLIENNVIVNTIEVKSLDFMPNLIDASIGGSIGWSYIDGILVEPKATVEVPKIISMRQAKLSLLNAGLLATVDTAIATGTDEAMKIEWEYATEVRRDWESLIAMATAIGLTSEQLDTLFIQASKL